LALYDADVARGTRLKLFEEHLGAFFPSNDPSFDNCFTAFRKVLIISILINTY
jgi:hypothetical protein